MVNFALQVNYSQKLATDISLRSSLTLHLSNFLLLGRIGTVYHQNEDLFIRFFHKIIFPRVFFFFRFIVHQLFIKSIVFFVFLFIVFQLVFISADFAVQFINNKERGFIKENHPDQKHTDCNGVFIQNIFLNGFEGFGLRLNVFNKFVFFHFNVFSTNF